MKEILEKTIREVPYNSLTPFFVNAGVDYPQELGGNCITQNTVLSEGLRSQGLKPSFLMSKTNGSDHYATVCMSEGTLFYLDPFLMHCEPIPLDRLFLEKELTLNSHPNHQGNYRRVLATSVGHGKFSIDLMGYSGSENGRILTYNFDLGKLLSELPSPGSEAFRKPLRKLSLRILRKDNQVSSLNLHPSTGHLDIYNINGARGFIRAATAPIRFREELKRIAEELNCPADKILHYLYLGYGIYKEEISKKNKIKKN